MPSVTYEDYPDARFIILWGVNPSTSGIHLVPYVRDAQKKGATLVVIDPRRIDLVRTPHIEAAHHLQLRPGTNVAIINALAHVVVTEGLVNEAYVAERCDTRSFNDWRAFVAKPENSPEASQHAQQAANKN